jgi:hypothetical protein
MALIYCPECGIQVSDQARACIKCAFPIAQKTNNIHSNNYQDKQPERVNSAMDLSGIDYYYELEFSEIHKSNGTYNGSFNWWAFFFSWIWCFTKGAWAWALIILGAILLGNILFARIPIIMILYGFGIAITLGFNATKIYYNVRIKNKQI